MSRSAAIADRAVFTTAMSSMSMAVAAQTTASVQRWVRVMSGGSEAADERDAVVVGGILGKAREAVAAARRRSGRCRRER